jgi:hypothetical protein
MKLSRMPFILAVFICLLPMASYPQGLSFGFGMGMGGREIVKIGPSAKAALRDYLKADYKRQCHAKKPPDTCQQTKPLYASSSLPSAGTFPLPPEVINKLGFIEPGTEYVQAGFVVYLIRLPRRIILDSVSATEPDNSSNIQW